MTNMNKKYLKIIEEFENLEKSLHDPSIVSDQKN